MTGRYEVWRWTLLGSRRRYGVHRFRIAAMLHAHWVRGEVVKRDA